MDIQFDPGASLRQYQRNEQVADAVGDLVRRAERLQARNLDAARPLREAAMRGHEMLDGKDMDRSAKTILARAAQYLHRDGRGNATTAVRLAEAADDELCAAYLKALASPHDTSLAALIAPTVLGPIIEALAPLSVYLRHIVPVELPLGVNAIKLPRLDTAPDPAWVGEAGAIPVAAGVTGDGVTLSVQKVASIAVASNELMRRSAFAGLLQAAILRKIAAAVDQRFFASDTLTDAPDGIFATGSGTSVTASATTTAEGAAEDFASLIATADAAGVNLALASFVINPTTRAALNKAATATGQLPFVGVQAFAGIPIESSVGCPAGRVGLIAWSEVIGVTQGVPQVALSQDATLEMDDAPADDILSVSSGGRSLFQRDSSALRITFPAGWANQHEVGACFIDGVAWD